MSLYYLFVAQGKRVSDILNHEMLFVEISGTLKSINALFCFMCYCGVSFIPEI